MTKEQLKRIALRLFNKKCIDFEDIRSSDEMHDATYQELCQCLGYIDQLMRIGTVEFSEKYCIDGK